MSIEVKNVVVGYQKDITILHGVSICAQKAKTTGIIGPNGAGKSTLLKAIYGFLKPKQGTIIFDESDITGREPYTLLRKGLAYVPQRFAVFPFLTVRENLAMGTWPFRKNKKRVMEFTNEVYERFPILKAREKVLATRLSGGEQRMLDLARALVTRPKTIIVDEPTAGLAPKVAEEIYLKLRDFAEEGISLLIVDQNIKKAITLSDRIYVLNMGRVTLEGSREEFNKKSKSLIKRWLI